MNTNTKEFASNRTRRWSCASALLAVALAILTLSAPTRAQDQDDPPGRIARLGYLQGSVSFEPAGESDWVQAAPNRPMTTGDKLWADPDARAEVELGTATIHLAPNTGISFLNLDDRTAQVELSSGTIDVRVRQLDRNGVLEIDTPNQAFTVDQPGSYRLDASEDGNTSVVTIREGEGESTGNGQTYTLHAGQRTTFTGTSPLNAETEQIGAPDDFDNWSYARERRYDESRSARYCSREVVGYEDLDDYGDWRPNPEYGNVWFPRVSAGWAPYHEGHWAWVDPWGWTWVDDDPWGFAPFHYGRWAFIESRWGWIPGPIAVQPVYAPALVVFVGGGGAAFGGNVGWFPLGPREVYVPSYRVSRGYVDRVNVTNTVVNTTVINNVYNTTYVNQGTNVTRVNYVNRNVQGAVTAVPQRAFASAQPVARSAVAVNAREVASAPVAARVTVPPAHQAVLGVHANTANRVAMPPRAVASRQVIAKATPPPPRPSFAAREQVLQAHPGQPVDRQEMQKLHPAHAAPQVKQAPPGKPATAMNRPANQPANEPGNRPGNPPANERPGAKPSQPAPAQPAPAPSNRPETNRSEPNRPPSAQPNNRPASEAAPNNRPESNHPETNRPEPNRPPSAQPNNRPPEAAPTNRPETNRRAEPPARTDRPPSAQPNNRPPSEAAPGARPETNRPESNRPPNAAPNNHPSEPPPNARPETNRPETNRPAEPSHPSAEPRSTPPSRPEPPPSNEQQQHAPPAETHPATQPQHQPPTEHKKPQDEQHKPPE
jgi:hypothetical protein